MTWKTELLCRIAAPLSERGAEKVRYNLLFDARRATVEVLFPVSLQITCNIDEYNRIRQRKGARASTVRHIKLHNLSELREKSRTNSGTFKIFMHTVQLDVFAEFMRIEREKCFVPFSLSTFSHRRLVRATYERQYWCTITAFGRHENNIEDRSGRKCTACCWSVRMNCSVCICIAVNACCMRDCNTLGVAKTTEINNLR